MSSILDIHGVRERFPGISDDEAYLDSASTTQKPQAVIDRLTWAYTEGCANIHRGVHRRSRLATDAVEEARRRVAHFLGVPSPTEIVWVRGATEGLNLLAHGLGHLRLQPGDEVLITEMEHHANIVPWQLACERHGAALQAIAIHPDGTLDLKDAASKITPKTRVVALTHASNSLGTINPVETIAAMAKRVDAVCVVDGTQMVVHNPVDIPALGVDAYVFSGHKLYGPSGIGAVWCRESLLRAMPPYQGGGDMILDVQIQGSTWNDPPHKFEAGTPHIAGAVGLGAAIQFMNSIGWEAIQEHERAILAYAEQCLSSIAGLQIIGTAADKVPVISFVLDGVHAHDVGTLLDDRQVAIRTGHHCTQPIMDKFEVPATGRASFGVYSTRAEVDRLADALRHVQSVFSL